MASLGIGDPIILSVAIENTGMYDGTEIVQLYIHDLVASVTRPVKELKAFKKVILKKGESKTVKFKLSATDFEFYNDVMKKTVEPVDFDIFIGGNSQTDNKVILHLRK